jgi:anthranilate phosphoribosyltransferase
MVAGRASSLGQGFALAQASVQGGHAANALEKLVELSND